MLSADSYGTGLGEWSYGLFGQAPAGGPTQGPSSRQRVNSQSPYGAYKPGQAQPMRQQGGGSKYGPPAQATASASPGFQPRYGAGTSSAYAAAHPDTGPFSDQGAAPGYDASGRSGWSDIPPRAASPVSTTPATFTPGGGLGNFAYATPDKRPQPFTTSVNFNGQQMDPGQFYGQRDAFINNINQARQPFAMNPSAGQQPMDFGAMWKQAGDMVQNGWQNPLAGLMSEGRFMAPPGTNARPPSNMLY